MIDRLRPASDRWTSMRQPHDTAINRGMCDVGRANSRLAHLWGRVWASADEPFYINHEARCSLPSRTSEHGRNEREEGGGARGEGADFRRGKPRESSRCSAETFVQTGVAHSALSQLMFVALLLLWKRMGWPAKLLRLFKAGSLSSIARKPLMRARQMGSTDLGDSDSIRAFSGPLLSNKSSSVENKSVGISRSLFCVLLPPTRPLPLSLPLKSVAYLPLPALCLLFCPVRRWTLSHDRGLRLECLFWSFRQKQSADCYARTIRQSSLQSFFCSPTVEHAVQKACLRCAAPSH